MEQKSKTGLSFGLVFCWVHSTKHTGLFWGYVPGCHNPE